MQAKYQTYAQVFKALSDPNRLAVLELLRGGERCACVIMDALGLSQPAVSYHMKILCQSGLVSSRQEGKWTHYRLEAAGCREAVELLSRLTTPDLTQTPCGE